MRAQVYATLAEALAKEEARWQARTAGVAVWSSAAAGLSVPAAYCAAPNFTAACALMQVRGCPVSVRRTGGGCVPQGNGVLNISWMPNDDDEGCGIDLLYQRFASAVIRGLLHIGITAACFSPPGAWCAGRYDIASRGRKLAGISQRHATGPKARSLVHAAIFANCVLEQNFDEMAVFLEAACCTERPKREAATTIALEMPPGVAAQEGGIADFVTAVASALVPSQMQMFDFSN